MSPTNQDKLFFWLILAFTSTCFAEIPAASTLFPLFDLWGFFVVIPLYGLHMLVLSSFLYARGNFRWQRLYLVGILFGLYEAYITKIIWNPGWKPLFPAVAQVYPFELLVICFFWHPFFSFFIPLILCETFLTDSRLIFSALPQSLQIFLSKPKQFFPFLVLVAIFTGAFQTANAPSALHSLISGLVNGVLLISLFWLWQRRFPQEKPKITQLLPGKTSFRWLLGALIVLYLVLGLFLQNQAFPGWIGHLTVWGIYGLVFGLIILDQKKAEKQTFPSNVQLQGSLTRLGILIGLFSLSSAVIKVFLPAAGPIVLLVGWMIMASSSLYLFIRLIISLIKRSEPV